MNLKLERDLWIERQTEIIASQTNIEKDLSEHKIAVRRLEIRLAIIDRMLEYATNEIKGIEAEINAEERKTD